MAKADMVTIVLFKEGFGDVAVSNISSDWRRLSRSCSRCSWRHILSTKWRTLRSKGTPHIITWVKGEKRKIETMKSGALAKLPRDILTRFANSRTPRSSASTTLSIWKPRLISSSSLAPQKLSIFKGAGSTSAHPITKDEIEAISGPYLEFARSWVTESVGTSSRAKVEAADLAIALPIVKFAPEDAMPMAPCQPGGSR